MKKIINHKDYNIDEEGNIYSSKYKTLRKMIQWHDKKGYLHVQLDNIDYRVHRLVAIAFIDNPLNLPQINHKDGNKSNNKIDNLEWCSNSENQLHAWGTGLQKTRKNINRKLSDEDVREIMNSNLSQRALSRNFNVNRTTIKSIINGSLYKEITCQKGVTTIP